jgi:opacity protein-like surface antigen
MTQRSPRLLLLVLIALLVVPATAAADIGAFLGVGTSPSNRVARGAHVGAGLLFIGFEFELSQTLEDVDAGAPSLLTGMGNVYGQTLPIHGVQFYGTIGGGMYREKLGEIHQETHFGINVGGGVKIGLAGPLKLRLDYRVFTLKGSPLYANPQRLYAGLTVGF